MKKNKKKQIQDEINEVIKIKQHFDIERDNLKKEIDYLASNQFKIQDNHVQDYKKSYTLRQKLNKNMTELEKETKSLSKGLQELEDLFNTSMIIILLLLTPLLLISIYGTYKYFF